MVGLAVPLDRAGTALATPSGITLVRPLIRDHMASTELQAGRLTEADVQRTTLTVAFAAIAPDKGSCA
jgi:hypothetical protein